MPPRARPPQRLSRQQHTYYRIGLPLGFIAVSVGIVGLFVLLDTEATSQLSQSQFGQLWRKAVSANPFIQAFMVNFGAIGFFFSLTKLLEHRKAVQEEQRQVQQQQQQEAARPYESRKSK